MMTRRMHLAFDGEAAGGMIGPIQVWAVERGEYSERSIVGVFSSKEAADAWVEANNDAEGGSLFVHHGLALDELAGQAYRRCWGATIYLRDGNLTRRHPSTFLLREGESRVSEVNRQYIDVWSPVGQEHADKVAVEARQEFLRTHAWIRKRFVGGPMDGRTEEGFGPPARKFVAPVLMRPTVHSGAIMGSASYDLESFDGKEAIYRFDSSSSWIPNPPLHPADPCSPA